MRNKRQPANPEQAFDAAFEHAQIYAGYYGFHDAEDLKNWGEDQEDARIAAVTADLENADDE